MPARYSRDTAVSAIRSFYQFFATLPTLPPEYIWEPPSGGWPEISSISLGHLGHNKDVIDLLRHIPYINDTQIAFQTTAIDYASDAMKWCLDKNAAQQGSIVPYAAGIIPEHVAVLTDGGRYGSWLLLDTRAGIAASIHYRFQTLLKFVRYGDGFQSDGTSGTRLSAKRASRALASISYPSDPRVL